MGSTLPPSHIVGFPVGISHNLDTHFLPYHTRKLWIKVLECLEIFTYNVQIVLCLSLGGRRRWHGINVRNGQMGDVVRLATGDHVAEGHIGDLGLLQ